MWILKSSVFWDITPCSPLKVNRRFRGTYRLYLQGRRTSRTRNQPESRWQTETCLFSLRPWRWSRYVSPKRQLTFNGLHSVRRQYTLETSANNTTKHKSSKKPRNGNTRIDTANNTVKNMGKSQNNEKQHPPRLDTNVRQLAEPLQ
jgi:hypothetical protein